MGWPDTPIFVAFWQESTRLETFQGKISICDSKIIFTSEMTEESKDELFGINTPFLVFPYRVDELFQIRVLLFLWAIKYHWSIMHNWIAVPVF